MFDRQDEICKSKNRIMCYMNFFLFLVEIDVGWDVTPCIVVDI